MYGGEGVRAHHLSLLFDDWLIFVVSHYRYHDWRIDENGNKQATGAATDAEEDIALTCIFAQHLVDKGMYVGRVELSRDRVIDYSLAWLTQGLPLLQSISIQVYGNLILPHKVLLMGNVVNR